MLMNSWIVFDYDVWIVFDYDGWIEYVMDILVMLKNLERII